MKTIAITTALLLAASTARAGDPASPRNLRSKDEISVLYAHAVLYGVGTGTWFDLQAKPTDFATAALPFAGFMLASVGAVGVADALRPFHRGEPHAIATGLYLGVGSGVWIVGMQSARARREGATQWSPETNATVLWSMSTFGGFIGAMIGFGIHPRPGQVSFIGSTTVWSGVLAALVAGAVMPDDQRRLEQAYMIGNAAYSAGNIAGILLSRPVSPSLARVRFVDLGGLSGGLVFLGTYAGIAGADFDSRAAAGLTAAGATVGLVSTWILTGRMIDDAPSKTGTLSVHPNVVPVPGGAGAGIGGVF